MRGFLFGCVVTATVGGLFYHLVAGYGTVSACAALQTSLTSAVIESLNQDLERELGRDGAGRASSLLLQPLAEPFVQGRVISYLADSFWFDCAYRLIRLDLGGGGDMVAAVRSLTVKL